MRSNQQFTFSQVPRAEIPRSNFRRSHGYKTTFDAGYLIPFFVDEALPGDTFNVKSSIFARLATPIVPVMDNIHLDVFFFAVPNRLLWDKWQRFCGEQPNPGDSTDFLVPQVESGLAASFGSGSLFDYMGIPPAVNNLKVCAFWARAYNLIWNEWFRDQNLQPRAAQNTGDGPDARTDYPLRKRGKRHDYFTSCLPWPQKGEGVQIPLGGTASVDITAKAGSYGRPTFNWSTVAGGYGQSAGPLYNAELMDGGNADSLIQANRAGGGTIPIGTPLFWDDPGLEGVANLEGAGAATINSLRQAFQYQKLQERDARGGTRYVELLKSHFGVTSPDARLQRPEFLGGGTVPVNINPVQQTAPTSGTEVKGSLAAYGVAGSSGIGFTKSFVEHSVLVGLIMARADMSYQQGIPRMFSRRTKYDFYWPALAHLGEQPVYNQEIFAQGIEGTGATQDQGVFGYQERWAEYRYSPSKITGLFRSDVSAGETTLHYWHLAQDFASLPALNGSFIEDPTGDTVDRIIAVPSQPQFLLDSFFSVNCARPMPVYSVPGYIDHF